MVRPFWQGCWSVRSVVVVEVNGYTIEPRADLEWELGREPLLSNRIEKLRG